MGGFDEKLRAWRDADKAARQVERQVWAEAILLDQLKLTSNDPEVRDKAARAKEARELEARRLRQFADTLLEIALRAAVEEGALRRAS